MGRLIDAEEFKKQIAGIAIANNYSPEKANALCELIDKQPTAYDKDRVVKQFENLKTINIDIGFGTLANTLRKEVVLDIVKGGGVDGESSFDYGYARIMQ